MMGRKGPRDKAHRAGGVTVSSARARLHRWLVVPAALTVVLQAALLGATPAQAAGACNLHYWWTPFNSPSAWVDAVITAGTPFSCTMSPAIARLSGGSKINTGSEILAALQDPVGYRTDRNLDGEPSWDLGGIFTGKSPGMPGAPSLISYSRGVEYAFPYGNGVYGNDLWYGWGPGGYPELGGLNQVSSGSKLEPWAPGMARTSGATEIAATGVDYSLWFYWNFDGTPTWHAEEVAGQGSVSGTPAMIAASGAMEIAATGADGSLSFY
jgi:hypothetical protein